jgi:hypothetical protein
MSKVMRISAACDVPAGLASKRDRWPKPCPSGPGRVNSEPHVRRACVSSLWSYTLLTRSLSILSSQDCLFRTPSTTFGTCHYYVAHIPYFYWTHSLPLLEHICFSACWQGLSAISVIHLTCGKHTAIAFNLCWATSRSYSIPTPPSLSKGQDSLKLK